MAKTKLYYHMKCIKESCGFVMPEDSNYYVCPKCGSLFLPEVDYDFVVSSAGGRGRSARRYLDGRRYGPQATEYPFGSGIYVYLPLLMPGFPVEAIVSLREGNTDLFQPPKELRKEIGIPNLFIKMEGQNPSLSFKDRGMSVAISEAKRLITHHPELGIKYVACASTGDTSASAAQYAAYHRNIMRCLVFLPYEKISNGQLAQAMMFGATIVAIKHDNGFDGCMALVKEFCQDRRDMVLVNSANAFRLIGQQTISLEILQDLRWQVPQWISLPVGNGGNLTAQLLACLRAKELGLIDELPGIIIAQTKSSDTLVRWVRSGFRDYSPGVFKETVASAMNIRNPVSFPRIQKLIEQFRILAYDVEEEQIEETMAMFNRRGADVCPQGAVALAALMQARSNGQVKEGDTVVAISTASSLKFVDSAIKYHLASPRPELANPYLVEPTGTIEGVNSLLAQVM